MKVLGFIGGIFLGLMLLGALSDRPGKPTTSNALPPGVTLNIDCPYYAAKYSNCALGIAAESGVIIGDAMGCDADFALVERLVGRVGLMIRTVAQPGLETDNALAEIKAASAAALQRREAGQASTPCAASLAALSSAFGR